MKTQPHLDENLRLVANLIMYVIVTYSSTIQYIFYYFSFILLIYNQLSNQINKSNNLLRESFHEYIFRLIKALWFY